jgi:alkanesulfonate monooxygenase SsuD/methylene tetrahydromethanopterin reductase-like flavin-dependent oxidoreductase (luciferase family)
MRETVDIVRAAFAGDKIAYSGSMHQIPLPDGEGKPMRLSTRAKHPIPVYLATLSPNMLALTGEIADGWLGTSFVPEGADAAYFAHLDAGLARAGRDRRDLDVCQGAEVSFVPDERALREVVASRKKELAFSLGGMGSVSTNFYNQAYSRQGWAETAAEVQTRWQAGDRDGAAELVTDEMVLATTLIGTELMVRDRLRVWQTPGSTPFACTRPATLSTRAWRRWAGRSPSSTRSPPEPTGPPTPRRGPSTVLFPRAADPGSRRRGRIDGEWLWDVGDARPDKP